MDLQLTGKKALVTGSGRGIGRTIAHSLAREGAQVIVTSRTTSEVESVLEEIGGTSQGHLGIAMDLMPEGAPALFVERLKEAGFESPDVVVHNLGGTLEVRDPMCGIEDWRNVWRFNVEIAVELNVMLIPAMQAKHWGRVVHISSIAAVENQGPITYCAAKAALTAYTRCFGRVLAPDGVVLTAVLPGAIMTKGGYWEDASRDRPDHVETYLADRMASHRFGDPEEVANLVTFLCSEHASFCIGSVVPVDGGQGRSYFGQ